MNEDERPLEDTQPTAGGSAPAGEPAEAVGDLVDQGTQAAADAAEQAEAAAEPLAMTPVPAPSAGAQEEAGAPRLEGSAWSTQAEDRSRPPRITDRLAEDTEYDPDANNDDRLLAALTYASQLIIPVVVPVILLISETSKKRAFQRYHAVQSLALGLVLWALQLGLGVLSSVAAVSIIGILCLCFIVPAMIAVWLLPLYYAILAYSGKRFRIPGLTQFLHDQGWL